MAGGMMSYSGEGRRAWHVTTGRLDGHCSCPQTSVSFAAGKSSCCSLDEATGGKCLQSSKLSYWRNTRQGGQISHRGGSIRGCLICLAYHQGTQLLFSGRARKKGSDAVFGFLSTFALFFLLDQAAQGHSSVEQPSFVSIEDIRGGIAFANGGESLMPISNSVWVDWSSFPTERWCSDVVNCNLSWMILAIYWKHWNHFHHQGGPFPGKACGPVARVPAVDL